MHVQMHPPVASGLVMSMAIVARNGMSAAELPDATWRKSARSGAVGNCVELACLDGGAVAVRNSRFPGGPALVYARAGIEAFAAGVRGGEFDDLVD